MPNYEKIKLANGDITELHYIAGGDGLAAIHVITTPNNQQPVTNNYYTYTDHLGSILTLTNEVGDKIFETNFDAWGRRRNVDYWTYNSTEPFIETGYDFSWLTRGYTGHEHLAEFGLINMNGRLYDPVLGRMLSPDNYVQSPFSSQSYNRYSYVVNNPLKYIDPTGDLTWNDVAGIGLIVGGTVLFIASGGVAYLSGGTLSGLAYFGASVGAGMVAGGIAYFGETLDQWYGSGKSWDEVSNNSFIGIRINVNPNDLFLGGKQRELKDWDMTPQPPIPLLADVKRNENISYQSPNSDFYYNALDGIIFNDGTKLSKDDFQLSFNDDATANARYLGFKNNKYLINFSMGDYETTADNIRATAIHEAFGHGKMGYGNNLNNHYKAYYSSIDSKYWTNTTLRFKSHTVNEMWNYFNRETGKNSLPNKYSELFWKYQTLYK